MKAFLLIGLTGVSAVIWAQQAKQESRLPSQHATRTFTSPDGAFRFEYSAKLVHCHKTAQKSGAGFYWSPSCGAYIPICDDQGREGSFPVACFAYPKEKFQNKPQFEGAAFSVEQVTNIKNNADCLRASPDWVIDEKAPSKTIAINGAHFQVFEVDGLGGGHVLDGHVYRTFHGQKCYQLSIRWVMITATIDPEPEKWTSKDSDEVNHSLEQLRDSFQFLK